MEDTLTCESCGAEFSVKNADENDNDSVEFCPYCGDELIEWDDVDDENEEWED
jgi:predicted RNA-binding Zn-ribbon protein involved in translation (DUF1610 family)